MRMGNLLSGDAVDEGMSDTESARLGVRHPTVVPSNYERSNEDGATDGGVGR
jgi:hypothetical protein